MCGIGALLLRPGCAAGEHAAATAAMRAAIARRGPDMAAAAPAAGGRLLLLASLLHMRGDAACGQPLVGAATADVFAWNGEVYRGEGAPSAPGEQARAHCDMHSRMHVRIRRAHGDMHSRMRRRVHVRMRPRGHVQADEGDTLAVWRALEACGGEPARVLTALGAIEGEYAFLFWHVSTRCVHSCVCIAFARAYALRACVHCCIGLARACALLLRACVHSVLFWPVRIHCRALERCMWWCVLSFCAQTR